MVVIPAAALAAADAHYLVIGSVLRNRLHASGDAQVEVAACRPARPEADVRAPGKIVATCIRRPGGNGMAHTAIWLASTEVVKIGGRRRAGATGDESGAARRAGEATIGSVG
jgi:hypothetical protein